MALEQPFKNRLSTGPLKVPDHEMLKLIGRGSYGEVWLARNVMGTYRAIKVVQRDAFDNDRPYEREYEGIRKFEPISRTHDSQVDVLQVGRDDHSFYYVMELADDSSLAASPSSQVDVEHYSPKTLRSEMNRRGPLPVDECVEVGLALTTALAHLHKNELVHRDIKPSNIIYLNGLPKLADIGLVCAFDATLSHVGTIGFVAPEGPGTPESDIYSLGKVLYEAATARDRQDFPELPTQLSGTKEQQTALLELNEVLLKACEGNPRDRYQSAEEMHEDLLLLRSGKSLVRLRTAERRYRIARRTGIAAATAAIVVAAAWFYQARQTQIVERLASENLKLAQAAERNAVESKERVLALQVANGVAEINNGGWGPMFLWFAEALRNVTPGSAREKIHRVRWSSFIENYPKLLHLFACKKRPYYCAYSPDGKRLASVEKDFKDEREGDLVMQDLDGEREVFRRSIQIAWHPAFFFSRGGKRLVLRAARAGERTTMYEAGNGAEIVLSPKLGVELLDTTDGESVLTLNKNGEAQLFDFDSGRALSPPVKLPEGAEGARLNQNGTVMGAQFKERSAGGMEPPQAPVVAYDLKTGHAKGPPLQLEAGLPWELTRDGAQLWIVRTRDNSKERRTVLVVDLETAKESSAQERPGEWFDAFVQTPPGLWVVSSDEAHTRLLNADTGYEVKIPFKPAGSWHRYSFSPDGLLMSIEWSVWNLADGSKVAPAAAHSGWAMCETFSPNGHELAGGSSDKTLRVSDIASCPVPELVIRERDKLQDAAFAPGERKIVSLSSWASAIRVWDAKTGKPAGPPLIDGFPLSTLFFSGDGRRVGALGGDVLKDGVLGKLRHAGAVLADIESATPKLLRVHTNAMVSAGQFTRDGTRVLTGGQDGVAAVWNAETGEQLLKLEHAAEVLDACFSPDERWIVTASIHGPIGLWDARTGERLRDISIPVVDSHEGAKFSSDGSALVISGNQTTRVWDWKNRRFTAGPLYHPGNPVLTAMNPMGRSFLTFSLWEGTKVWNLDGELEMPLLFHKGAVVGAEFSRDGRSILSCSNDGTARLWDGVTGEPVLLPLEHRGGAWAAHFGSSGQRFITAGDDCTMRVWKVPKPSMLTLEEIRTLAELWSHGRLDRTGTFSRLEPEEILARYKSLRERHPGLFQPNVAARVEWHERMALAAGKGKFWKSVIWHTDAALRLNPALVESPGADELFNRRGYARAELGDFSGASADFQRAVQIDSDEVYNWWNLVVSLLGTGKKESYEAAVLKAIKHFETVKELGFTVGIRDWALAKLSFMAPSPALKDKPIELIDRIPQPYRDRWFQTDRGAALIRAGRLDEGIALIQKAVAEGRATTDKCEVFMFLAIAQAQRGLFDEARKSLDVAEKDMERLDSKADTRPEILARTIYTTLRKEALALLGRKGVSP